MLGPYMWAYWTMCFCNIVVPQFFWFKKCRTNPFLIVGLALLVNVGMWFERFVIIVTSLHRDFLPSSWRYYTPSKIEIATFLGSFGLFFTLFFLFCRFLPVLAMAEVKGVLGYGRRRKEETPSEPVAATVAKSAGGVA